MFVRKTVNAFAGTAALGLGVMMLATPSHANTTVTVTGTYASSAWTAVSVSPSAVFGETVTIVIATEGRDELRIVSDLLYEDSPDDACGGDGCYVEVGDSPYLFQIRSSASAATVEIRDNATVEGVRETIGSFTVTYGSPSDDPGRSASGPAPLIQQFPMPAAGACDEAQPEGLNWGGVSSGGWGESWARWMNDGEGGFVCTRTLAYNTSTAAWEVN